MDKPAPNVGLLALLLLLSAACATADRRLDPEPRPDQELTILTPLAPSDLGGRRSAEGNVPTSITFENTLAEHVTVWWIDYSGKEVFYLTLTPHQKFDQLTFLTHPWLVRRAPSGTALVGFLPTRQPGVARIIDRSESRAPVPEPPTLLIIGPGIATVAPRRLRNG